MKKVSFFRLPAIFVVLYFICGTILLKGEYLVSFFFMVINGNDPDKLSLLLQFMFYYLFHFIPVCLLLFMVASVCLYRANVNILTIRNIILLSVNVLFTITITHFLDAITFDFYINEFMDGSYPWLRAFEYVTLSMMMVFLCCGFFSYCFIKVLGDKFDRDSRSFVFTRDNCACIHFILFLACLFFVVIEIFILVVDMDSTTNRWPILCTILLIFLVIVIFETQNLFTCNFNKLQFGLVIRSVIESVIWLLTFNLGFMFFSAICGQIFSFIDSSYDFLLIMSLYFVIWQLVFCGMIPGRLVKKYFSIKADNIA